MVPSTWMVPKVRISIFVGEISYTAAAVLATPLCDSEPKPRPVVESIANRINAARRGGRLLAG